MSSQDQTTQNQTVTGDRDERLATHDLLDTAAGEGEFTRFLGELSAAGLESLMRGPELFTVFIPTNDAFIQAGEGWQSVDRSKTADRIRRHFVPGALTAVELASTQLVNTLQGLPLRVTAANGEVRVGGARIVRPDIECTNGVLHVIDQVLE